MGDVRVKAERRAITDIAGVDTLDIALIRRTSNPSHTPSASPAVQLVYQPDRCLGSDDRCLMQGHPLLLPRP